MSVGSAVERTRAAHLGPDRRRPQVLDAALQIALDDGVAGVSIASVAVRLGVTRPVVYSCFSGRNALLDALLEREEERLLGGALEALEPSSSRPRDVFVAGFQALLTTVAAHPDSWRLLFDSLPEPSIADRFGRARRHVADRFAALLRPLLEAWGTEDADRKLPVLVEMFMSTSEGAVRTLLEDGSGWTPEELGELVGSAVHRAFRHV